MSKDQFGSERERIVTKLNSGMIFTNRKTDFCVEFNICPLMKLEKRENKDVFTSPKCKSCYSTELLNISKHLRNKILNIPKEKLHLVNTFEKDIQDIIRLSSTSSLGETKRLRFYGLTDFQSDNIPFIFIASKHIIVDIISKTLSMRHNEIYLKKLINQPNIWISLSFNNKYIKELARIKEILVETKAKNVQLNYCMHTKEENIKDEFFEQFQVIHLRDQDKTKVLKMGIPETKICGLYDREGNSLKPKQKGTHCKNCSNCHIPYYKV
jgi:predicted Zn-ribbon and HTH transcriptional regulator